VVLITGESDKGEICSMKNIAKDEMYNWMPVEDKEFADAAIPDELYEKLCDSIAHYKNACKMIYGYLEEHPENEFKI
jgi:hypothetical protein